MIYLVSCLDSESLRGLYDVELKPTDNVWVLPVCCMECDVPDYIGWEKVSGRGGTSFVPVIEYINKNSYFRDSVLIYFTDGFIEPKEIKLKFIGSDIVPPLYATNSTSRLPAIRESNQLPYKSTCILLTLSRIINLNCSSEQI